MLISSRRRIVAATAATIPVAFLAIFLAWPLVATARRALGSTGLAATRAPIEASDIARAALTTLSLSSAGTALTLVLAIPAAIALHRHSWRGARVIESALTAPFVLPTVVVALAFLTLQRDLLDWLGAGHGIPAIIGALAFFNIGVVLRTVGPAIDSLDERLVAAARTLGASPGQVMLRVVWPGIRRSVGAATAVTFLFCSTSFALVLILGGTRIRTLEAATYLELTTFLDLRGAATIALVQVAMLVTLAVVSRRLTTQAGVPTNPSTSWRGVATRRTGVGIFLAIAPAAILIAVPIGALLWRALGGPSGLTMRYFAALWDGTSSQVSLRQSLTSSLTIALLAAALACLLGGLATTATALDPRLRWLRVATAGPLAVSSVVVGVGLLLGLAVPLRNWSLGTTVLLVAAQALIALPLVVRVLSPAVDSLDLRQLAAAATLGAPPQKILTRIIVPRLRPALASAAGLAFAVTLGEFGASIFLVRPGVPTLPTTIVRLLSRPGADNFGTAAAGAVVLAAIAATAMLAADLLPRKGRT